MTRILFFILLSIFSYSFISADGTNFEENRKTILKDKIVISPNPAKTVTRVITQSSSIKISKVEIYSITNDKVLEVNSVVPTNSLEINVFKLNKGRYYVKAYLTDKTEEFSTLMKL